MLKLIKKRSSKIGAPPGTLVHIGEKRTEKVKITVFDYNETYYEEKEVTTIEECYPFKERPSITWINIDGVHDPEIIEKIGLHFNIHPLILEDILNTEQRPKYDDFGDYIFTVIKMIYYDAHNSEIIVEQVSFILGKNFVLSFQEKEGDVFDPIRERIRKSKGLIRKVKADYLAYALFDVIVDNYFTILEKIGEDIELIEDELVSNPTPQTLQTIHNLKRDTIYLRKSTWPLREVINRLDRGESPLINQSTRIYLKDVYDHTIQVIDTVETLRDMISGMLDIYLSSISNRMNEVMKTLTIFAAIFIPLTCIVGIYGMNFDFMPELGYKWSYPILLGVMFVIGGSMVLYFKKKKWF